MENKYINTSIKDIYKKCSKHFQELLFYGPIKPLPPVEFIRWCPYLELDPLKFLHNEM